MMSTPRAEEEKGILSKLELKEEEIEHYYSIYQKLNFCCQNEKVIIIFYKSFVLEYSSYPKTP